VHKGEYISAPVINRVDYIEKEDIFAACV